MRPTKQLLELIFLAFFVLTSCNHKLCISDNLTIDLTKTSITNNKQINDYLLKFGNIEGKIIAPYNDIFGSNEIYSHIRFYNSRKEIGSFYLEVIDQKIIVTWFRFGDVNSDDILRGDIILNELICDEILKQDQINFNVVFVNAETKDTCSGKEFLDKIVDLSKKK